MQNLIDIHLMSLVISRDVNWDGLTDAPQPRATRNLATLDHPFALSGPGSILEWLSTCELQYCQESENLVLFCPGAFGNTEVVEINDSGMVIAMLVEQHRLNATRLQGKIVPRAQSDRPQTPLPLFSEPQQRLPDTTPAPVRAARAIDQFTTTRRFFAQKLPRSTNPAVIPRELSERDRAVISSHFRIEPAASNQLGEGLSVPGLRRSVGVPEMLLVSRGAAILGDALVGLLCSRDSMHRTKDVLLLVSQQHRINEQAKDVPFHIPYSDKPSHCRSDGKPDVTCSVNTDGLFRCMCEKFRQAYQRTHVSDWTLIICANEDEIHRYMETYFNAFNEEAAGKLPTAVLGTPPQQFAHLVYSLSHDSKGYTMHSPSGERISASLWPRHPTIILSTLSQLSMVHPLPISMLVVDETSASMIASEQLTRLIANYYVLDQSEQTSEDQQRILEQTPVRLLFVTPVDWRNDGSFKPYFHMIRTVQENLWSHIQKAYYSTTLGRFASRLANALAQIKTIKKGSNDKIVFASKRSHGFRALACAVSVDDTDVAVVDARAEMKDRLAPLENCTFHDQHVTYTPEELAVCKNAFEHLNHNIEQLLQGKRRDRRIAFDEQFCVARLLTTMPSLKLHLVEGCFHGWHMSGSAGQFVGDATTNHVAGSQPVSKEQNSIPNAELSQRLCEIVAPCSRMQWLCRILLDSPAHRNDEAISSPVVKYRAALVVTREELSAVAATSVLTKGLPEYVVQWLPIHCTQATRLSLLRRTIDQNMMVEIDGGGDEESDVLRGSFAVVSTLGAIPADADLGVFDTCVFLEPAQDRDDEIELATRLAPCSFFRPSHKGLGVEEMVRVDSKRMQWDARIERL